MVSYAGAAAPIWRNSTKKEYIISIMIVVVITVVIIMRENDVSMRLAPFPTASLGLIP